MRCKSWNDDWVAHLYGELQAEEEQAMLRHFADCTSCRRSMDELSEARRLLAAAPGVPNVPWARIAPPSPGWSWKTAGAFAAGVLVAALCFGMGLVASGREGVPAGPEPYQAELQAIGDRLATLEAQDAVLTERVTGVEYRSVTPARLKQELAAAETRFNRERGRDLEYVMETMTASELRNATWKDRTNEALQLIALRQDPRLSER